MHHSPYHLLPDVPGGPTYYALIDEFAAEIRTEAELRVGTLLDEYMNFLRTYRLEDGRERDEYLLELLGFGILWDTYAEMALSVRWAPTITLAKMAEWRKKHRRWKPFIDAFRGIAMTALLMPTRRRKITGPPSLEMIDRVCLWFEATGEFREEALRYIRWRGFWGTLNREELDSRLLAIGDLARWFRERAESVLGDYTRQVEEFRLTREKSYRWKEDRLSCLRPRVEYHLNMVGAVLMNSAFRKDFMDADSTALLLPGCMRSRGEGECQARREDRGLLCMGCTRDCPVNALREKGKVDHFTVYILPHASDLSLWAPAPGRPKCRVVASACITTLVEGGWELRRYGVPAQCVPLDYSGCKKHWHPEGRTTSFNAQEFHRILQPESSPPVLAD